MIQFQKQYHVLTDTEYEKRKEITDIFLAQFKLFVQAYSLG